MSSASSCFVVVVAVVVACTIITITAYAPPGDPGAQKLRQAPPGVVFGVELEEVVLAAVPRELELRADLVWW